jgi:cell division protein FtsI (penicillin-binding protein 3)
MSRFSDRAEARGPRPEARSARIVAPPPRAATKVAPRPVKPMTPGIPKAARARAYATAGVLVLGLVGIGVEAWGLQVEQGARFRTLAARQHVLSVEVAAPRGAIVDTQGRPLALTADAESVWVDPYAVVDVAATADQLASLLDQDVRVIEARLAARRHFAWIARHVTPEIAQAVRAADLPGVEITREPRRWYPGKAAIGTLVGIASVDGEGLDGVELSMDGVLAGTRAKGAAVRDARGRAMYEDGMVAPEPGATVRLTIDQTIQAIADDALAAAVDAHHALSGVAVVLDVETSHVLAIASSPRFDPNLAGPHTGARNRAITDTYEIGSVMKVFTIATALDLGVTRPDEWWDVEEGSWEYAGKRIRDTHHDFSLTTSGVIKRSSNVGAVKIALRLGRERVHAGLVKFGFGSETGIELPGEQRGRLRPPGKWRDIELATAAYGYGYSVTPIQIAAAMAAIGNGGVYRAPRIVASVTRADGAAVELIAPVSHQAVSAGTAKKLIPMLASVFDGNGTKSAGTAAAVWVPGFKCGGKTGTAHKYDPAIKAYAEDRYLSSFAGLAPISDPRLAIVVIVDDPAGGDYYGGKVAGPVFAAIASETLRYLAVPGDAPLEAPPPPKR